jgi:hypothetical protein
MIYRPALLGLGRVHFQDAKRGVDHTEEISLLADFTGGARAVDWLDAREIAVTEDDLAPEPPTDPAGDPAAGRAATWEEPPAPAREPKSYTTWKRELSDTLYRNRRLTLLSHPLLGETSRPGESERDFRIRVAPLLRAERDRRLAEVESRLGERLGRLDESIRKAEARHQREAAQVTDKKRDSWISTAAAFVTIGSTLLGSKGLSRSTLGRATSAARGLGRVQKEEREAEEAAARVAELQAERDALARELDAELQRLAAEIDRSADALERVEIAPRRVDVEVRWTGLAWVPVPPGTPS